MELLFIIALLLLAEMVSPHHHHGAFAICGNVPMADLPLQTSGYAFKFTGPASRHFSICHLGSSRCRIRGRRFTADDGKRTMHRALQCASTSMHAANEGGAGGMGGGASEGAQKSTFRRNEVKFHGRPTFQEPVVIPAAEEHTATLIFLHGFGSQGPGRGKLLADSLNIPWCKIVCPLAPQRPAALGQALQSWSSVDLLLGQRVTDIPQQALSFANTMTGIFKNVAAGKLGPAQVLDQFNEQVLEQRRFGLTPIKGDTTDILRNAEYIKTLIRAEGRAGIPSERIMLVGFSQGGCQALSCALQMQIPLAGVAALSTWFPQGEETSSLAPNLQGMPLYVVHGDADWVVPVELGRKLRSTCQGIGFNVRYDEVAGLGHDITEDVCRSLRRFFQEQVPRIAPMNESVWADIIVADSPLRIGLGDINLI